MGNGILTLIVIALVIFGGVLAYNEGYFGGFSEQSAKNQQIRFFEAYITDLYQVEVEGDLEEEDIHEMIVQHVDNYFEAVKIKCNESGGEFIIQQSELFSAFPEVEGYEGLDIGCSINGEKISGNELLQTTDFERVVCESEIYNAIEDRNYEECSNFNKCTNPNYYKKECKKRICDEEYMLAVDSLDIDNCNSLRNQCSSFRDGGADYVGYTIPDRCISDIAHLEQDASLCDEMEDSRVITWPGEDFEHIMECKVSVWKMYSDWHECEVFMGEEKANCIKVFFGFKDYGHDTSYKNLPEAWEYDERLPWGWCNFCKDNQDVSQYFEECSIENWEGLC